MTRPSTVAAIAVLACAPALWAFASAEMSLAGLLVRYLVALVVVSVGLHLLARLWGAYVNHDGDGNDGASRRANEPDR